MDGKVLSTPNSIAQGKYSIGEKENNLFLKIMYCIQKQNREYMFVKGPNEELTEEDIKRLEYLNEVEFLDCKITKDELFSIIKKDSDRTVEGMNDICRALMGCDMTFNTVTRNKVKATMTAPLISHYYREEKTGDYQFVVPAKLYKYLLDLGFGYTQNALSILLSLKGVYSKRLYLIFRSWTGAKRKIEFKVSDLREMLQLKGNNTYNSFETNVLKRAISEINKMGVMEIEIIDKIKKGRTVDKVVFNVVDKEPRVYFDMVEKEDKTVLLFDYIRVQDEELAERVEKNIEERGDIRSPIVIGIAKRAYDKTLAKDNRFKMIEASGKRNNFELFKAILVGEFLTHEIRQQDI